MEGIKCTTEEIDNLLSRKFRANDWSDFPNVTAFIDMLFQEYVYWAKRTDGQRRIKNEDSIRTHLGCLTLELFRTYCINPKLCLAISLGNETISHYKKSRYKPSHITFRTLNHVFNFLWAVDYIELPFGEKGRVTGAPSHQRATRVRASEKLIYIVVKGGFHITQYMINQNLMPAESIVLRDVKRKGQSKGDSIEYEDTKFTERARENLKTINKCLAEHHIDIKITDEREHELAERLREREDKNKTKFLDLTDKQLKRVFNNRSFEEGGRFYGGFWQNIPKEYRFLITINGEHTAQFDYSGMHIAILYAKEGLPLPESDVYQLDDYDSRLRGDIKYAFNTLINCENKEQGFASINGKIKKGKISEDIGSGEALYDAFISRHEAIAKYIASGEGIKLQFMDSEIAEKVLLQGVNKGACILPIHDGFITSVKHEHLLFNVMREAYEEIIGQEINVKHESIYLELVDSSLKGQSSVKGVRDESGQIQYEEVGNYTGGVESYSSILEVDDVLEHMERCKGYQLREDVWCETYGGF